MKPFVTKLGKAISNPGSAVDYGLRRLGIEGKANAYRKWERAGFAPPSPDFIKQAVLLRNGLDSATWVETGTYMGSTTRRLSGVGKKVYSIEPEPTLYANAVKTFLRTSNVEIINGISEEVFPELLPMLSGDICFWLDGHFSSGITYKGPQDTPIYDELRNIAVNMSKYRRIVVMVDDVRCFDPRNSEYSTYPPVDFLVDWARENRLRWHIEHDIFVARN